MRVILVLLYLGILETQALCELRPMRCCQCLQSVKINSNHSTLPKKSFSVIIIDLMFYSMKWRIPAYSVYSRLGPVDVVNRRRNRPRLLPLRLPEGWHPRSEINIKCLGLNMLLLTTLLQNQRVLRVYRTSTFYSPAQLHIPAPTRIGLLFRPIRPFQYHHPVLAV